MLDGESCQASCHHEGTDWLLPVYKGPATAPTIIALIGGSRKRCPGEATSGKYLSSVVVKLMLLPNSPGEPDAPVPE
jgi:hypothetical protein